ncbi:MAG: hypothetical protein E7056_05765 [Lentisphaerae bacterium]|nr:hypothetical protein [Lentisphaerota bacterium]
MKKILLVLGLCAAVQLSFAAPKLAMQPVFPEKKSLLIKPSVNGGTAEVEFPAVTPKDKYGVVLSFDCRIVIPKGCGGWTHNMSVDINGKNISKITGEGSPRLLLRGETLKSSTSRPEIDWWEGSKLLAFYAAENELELDKRALSARDQRYRYLLDVSDMLNYNEIGADDRIEGGEPNKFVFKDLLPSTVVNAPMSFKNIQLFFVKRSDIIKASGMKMTKFTPAAKVAALKCNGADVAVMPNGGMSVTINGEKFFVESNFSYEAKPRYKNNRFNVSSKKEGAGDWRVKVRQVSDKVISVKGSFRDYTVERILTLNNHRIDVKDSYTNTSARDIGILWNHVVGRNALLNPTSRLAGQTLVKLVRFFGSANATLYAAGNKSGLGLVAEDTVSRAQLELRSMGNTQSMGSIGMGIPAGKTYTLEWAIYPLAESDYYALINQVRRDWKVNYTIDGPFYFGGSTVKSCMIKPLTPWHNYDSGKNLTQEQYGAVIKKQMAALRKINPDTKFIGMIETNLVPFDTTQVPWGKNLKVRTGERNQPGVKYGIFMDKETTGLFDAYSPYRDSVIRDEHGNAMYENYYASAPHVNLMVQPEIGNHRYKTFMAQIDFMMNDLGLNGIYIDQFQPYIIGGFSEDRWDGYTVELSEDGSIKRKRYSYALTGAAARGNIIKTVRDRGGVVVTNGQPMSREEQNTGVFAFQEMENNSVNPLNFLDVKPPECSWQTISHLGSPIALGIRPARYVKNGAKPEQFAQMQTKGIITALRNGLLFYYYTVNITDEGPAKGSQAICDNMFPFTPEELHDGWIKGKERTITAISGKFPVNGQEKPKVLYFDKKGFEQPNNFAVSGTPGNWIVEVKLNDWNEVAIMLAQ